MIELVEVRGRRAVIQTVDHAVAVQIAARAIARIRVAGVADPIAVAIALVRVGRERAVVAVVSSPACKAIDSIRL